MPLYEYSCKACGNRFEALVRGDAKPACPSCKGQQLERLLSLPTVKSETTRQQALKAAQKRDKAMATDRMHDRLRYEESHDRHG